MPGRSGRSFKSRAARDILITSIANAKVKFARGLSNKKNRAAFRQFTAEGVRLIEEGERAGRNPALVFFEPDLVATNARAGLVLERLRARTQEVHAVTRSVLNSLAQTDIPQGIVAVYPFPELRLTHDPRLVLVLDSIRDPGNVGVILRTAWACAVDEVLLAPGTADPFNPKIIRSAMGAHFWTPIASISWAEIGRIIGTFPRIYLADVRGEQDIGSTDWTSPLALIVGGEAFGPTGEAKRLATSSVSIPMPGNAESLNASVAAGILLFEATRQRD